jgi:hypothetical protein
VCIASDPCLPSNEENKKNKHRIQIRENNLKNIIPRNGTFQEGREADVAQSDASNRGLSFYFFEFKSIKN